MLTAGGAMGRGVLDGRVAIVTGAGIGLGRGIALGYAHDGALDEGKGRREEPCPAGSPSGPTHRYNGTRLTSGGVGAYAQPGEPGGLVAPQPRLMPPPSATMRLNCGRSLPTGGGRHGVPVRSA